MSFFLGFSSNAGGFRNQHSYLIIATQPTAMNAATIARTVCLNLHENGTLQLPSLFAAARTIMRCREQNGRSGPRITVIIPRWFSELRRRRISSLHGRLFPKINIISLGIKSESPYVVSVAGGPPSAWSISGGAPSFRAFCERVGDALRK